MLWSLVMPYFPRRAFSRRTPSSRGNHRRDRNVRPFETLEDRLALTAGVNDPPQGSDATFSINEDSVFSFRGGSFGASDPVDASEGGINMLSAVFITGLPRAGVLSLNGSPVTAGQRIPVAWLSFPTYGLTFTPAANAFGSPYASIEFRVQDDGGTVFGGVDTDPTPNVITINVLPVNDAPTIAPISGPTYVSPTDTTAVARGQIQATDIDPGTTLTYGLESPTVDNGVIESKEGRFGTLYVMKATGAYEFHPNSTAINALFRNATESFRVVVSDGSSTVTATLTVAAVARNNGPELVRRTGSATTQLVTSGNGALHTAQQSDERIIVAGVSLGESTGSDLSVMRYTTSGLLDPSFGSNGVFTNTAFASVGGMAVQPDGKIVVVGSTSVRGSTNSNLAVTRLLPDGSPDASFGAAGVYKLVTSQIDSSKGHAVALQSDGKIVIVGFAGIDRNLFSALDYDILIIRLNQDGTADHSFSSTGFATFASVGQGGFKNAVDRGFAVAIQTDGRILVGGTSDTDRSNYSATFQALILRLHADGSKDTSFGQGGTRAFVVSGSTEKLNTINSIAVAKDGSIVVAIPNGVARFTANGTADSSFVSALSGIGVDSHVSLDGEGRIIVGTTKKIYRLLPAGGLDTTFGTGGTKSTLIDGLRVWVQPDGRLLFGGQNSFSVQRFLDNGAEDVTFGDIAGRIEGTAFYTEGFNPAVISPSAGVTDLELSPLNAGLGNFSGASVAVARSSQPRESDIFGFALGTTSTNAKQALFTLSGDNALLFGGSRFGVASQSGGRVMIQFEGTGVGGTAIPTTALVNDVLQRITYRNTSVVPPPTVELTWTFSDGNAGRQGGGGPLLATGTSVINITPTNSAPLSISFANPTTTLAANANTAVRIKLADIAVEDDGMGANALSIASGLDGTSFEIVDRALYLRAGVALNPLLKPTYAVRVEASDASVPFSTVAANFTLSVVRSTPTRPASLSAVTAAPGNQRVILNWSAPTDDGGSPITNYEIMVAEQTGGVWSSYRSVTRPASTATSAEVTGLSNGKVHIFVVRAVNAVGAGPWVTLSRVVTPIGTSPGGVLALTATPGNQRVTLNWSAPTSDGGSRITNYEIMVAEQTGSKWSSYRPVARPASTATSAEVTGLTNGKAHIFVVRALNIAGAGPWVTLSRLVTPTATIPGVVSALTATPGNQHVTLKWSAPTNDGGSPITNYEIMVAEQTGGVWSSYRPITRAASTATSAEVTGLANGKVHIFVVRALNIAGAGPWVTLSRLVTPTATIPGVVSALTATPGNQRVTLKWSAPTNDGGSPITNYEIMVAEQTGGVWSSYRPITRAASTATSAEVTGLTNGKVHIFVVRVVNARGAGRWQTLLPAVTPLA